MDDPVRVSLAGLRTWLFDVFPATDAEAMYQDHLAEARADEPLKLGDSSLPGETVTCAFCQHTSDNGEHTWLLDEDGPGMWACEDEDACQARCDN